jgi:hypothetical protein
MGNDIRTPVMEFMVPGHVSRLLPSPERIITICILRLKYLFHFHLDPRICEPVWIAMELKDGKPDRVLCDKTMQG